jgi:hypothetical protein
MPIKDYELKRDELQEIGLQIRHYSNLRFAVLTVLFAFLGGAVTISTNLQQQSINEFYVTSVKVAGLLGTLVFWYFELRLAGFLEKYETRADEIEKQLKYQVYSGRLKVRIKTTWIMGSLYFAVLLFWILSIVLF